MCSSQSMVSTTHESILRPSSQANPADPRIKIHGGTKKTGTRVKIYISDEERYENEAMSWPEPPTENGHQHQQQVEVVEKDNPFRPGGELSREAEIIVQLIKQGKPLVPYIYENGHMKNGVLTQSSQDHSQTTISPSSDKTDHNSNARGAKNGKGGGKKQSGKNDMSPGSQTSNQSKRGEVEVTHGIVIPPNAANQTVEQVHIKKSNKCCVIQ